MKSPASSDVGLFLLQIDTFIKLPLLTQHDYNSKILLR